MCFLFCVVIFIAMKYGHKSTELQDYTNQARAPLPTPPKKIRFCAQYDTKVLRAFLISRNQPLELADDYYFQILKNNIKKIRRTYFTKFDKNRTYGLT